MQITCPGCGESVHAGTDTAPDGRVRVQCPGCDARLLVKINRPDLKVDDRIPTDNGDPDARAASLEALERFSIDVGSGEFSTTGAGMRVVVVTALPDAARPALMQRLIRIPRFSRNPNKIHDATSELPYVLQGLEAEEADQVEALVVEQGGTCVAGPEWRVLDEAGHPRDLTPTAEPVEVEEFGEPDDGLLVVGDEDEDEDEDLLVAGDDGEVLMAEDSGEVGLPDEEGLVVAGDGIELDEDVTPTVAPRKEPGWLGSLTRPGLTDRRPRPTAPEPSLFAPSDEGTPDDPDPFVPPPAEVEEPDEPEADLDPVTYDDLIAIDATDDLPLDGLPAQVGIVTVEQMPEQGEPLGVVTVSLEVPLSAAAGSRSAAVTEAIRSGEEQLRGKALALGATMIVALRTTATELSDGGLLVVMQGTATR